MTGQIAEDEGMVYGANERIQDVTYWVRYIENKGAIEIVSVYSHRMNVHNE